MLRERYKYEMQHMPSRSRERRKEQDSQASWDRLRTAPWSPFEPHGAQGSGRQRIQLIHLPSFWPPVFWEVCQLGSQWLLYSSKVVDPWWPTIRVQGYEPVTFDGDRLRSFFSRLTSLTLPIAPHLSDMVGLDGEITQLSLFGDLHSHARFQWWSGHPPAWKPLVEIAKEMLNEFDRPLPVQ
jgi:hypothetical protein